jgi:uncharacterized membrane protein YkvA (DUF1232 family)
MGNFNSVRQNCEEKAQDPAEIAIAAALPRVQKLYDAFALKFVGSDLYTIVRLVTCSLSGTYKVNRQTFLILAGAILYVVTPCDAIPDAIPIAGYLDDAYALRLAVNSCSSEIERFKQWEQQQKRQ